MIKQIVIVHRAASPMCFVDFHLAMTLDVRNNRVGELDCARSPTQREQRRRFVQYPAIRNMHAPRESRSPVSRLLRCFRDEISRDVTSRVIARACTRATS